MLTELGSRDKGSCETLTGWKSPLWIKGQCQAEHARVGELNRGLRLAFQTLEVGRILMAAQSLGLLAAYREVATRAVERHADQRQILQSVHRPGAPGDGDRGALHRRAQRAAHV